MCYFVYFSTTSKEDFAELESEHFKIYPADPQADANCVELLGFPHRWYLECKYGGCSCHFRHDADGLGFGPVEDWSPEDADDVESTQHFYDLLKRILAEGHRLDVLDVWDHEPGKDVRLASVELGKVPRDHFRFLQDVRMILTP